MNNSNSKSDTEFFSEDRYEDVIIYSKNLSIVEQEMKAIGGRVTHKLSNQVYIVRVARGLKIDNLKNCSLYPQEDLDEISQLVVKAWNQMQTMCKSKAFGEQPVISRDDRLRPKNAYNEPALRDYKDITALVPADTCQYMTGKIAIGLIIVSGETFGGEKLVFDDGHTGVIISQCYTATNLLANADPDAEITFVYDIQRPSIIADPGPYNPGYREARRYEALEAPWRNAAFQEMGYSGSYSDINKYTQSIISKENTNWGCVIFFCKYPVGHSAYANDQRMVMSQNGYNNAGVLRHDWGGYKEEEFHEAVAHELCHLFGAADEYGRCVTKPSGTWGIPNDNCGIGPTPPNKIKCLMGGEPGVTALCGYTRAQIGWQWWKSKKVRDEAGTYGGFGLVEFKGGLYVGIMKNNEDKLGIFSSSNGQDEPHYLELASNAVGIGLARFRDKLYVACTAGNSQKIYTSFTSDGSKWNTPLLVADDWYASGGIGLAEFQDKLYMVCIGTNEVIYVNSSADGINWASLKLSGWKASGGIGLTVFKDRLYMVAIGTDSAIYVNSSADGTNWESTKVDGWEASHGIGLVAYKNDFEEQLYMIYEGTGLGNRFYVGSSYNGKDWTTRRTPKGWDSKFGIGATVFNKELYIAYYGSGSGGIYMAHSKYPYI